MVSGSAPGVTIPAAGAVWLGADGAGTAPVGPAKDGTHLWWKVLGRNKRSVTLDMRGEDGRATAQRLVAWADVVVVTFRADTVVKYGLDWDSVQAANPSAVLLQISGYGARSSKRNAPGFGKMGEARSGVVHLTGFPDGPPVHTGFSHGGGTHGMIEGQPQEIPLGRHMAVDRGLADAEFLREHWLQHSGKHIDGSARSEWYQQLYRPVGPCGGGHRHV